MFATGGAGQQAETGARTLGKMWFRLLKIDMLSGSDAEARLHQRRIDAHLLVIAFDAAGKLSVDGMSNTVRRGCAVVCAPGQLVHYYWESPSVPLYMLWFDTGAADGSSSRGSPCLFPTLGAVSVTEVTEAWTICDRLERQWRKDDELERLRCQSDFLALLYLILKAARGAPAEETGQELERVRHYLEQRYAEEINISKLAGMAGLSPNHFMRLFRKTFGVSAMDYVTQVRLGKAKQLMTGSGASVRDAAVQVGYSDDLYFRKLFKKHIGVPPNVYVRSNARKIAAFSFPNLGALLALDVVPFAAPIDHYWTDYYRTKLRYDVSVPLGHQYEFNIEALRKAKPELIVAMDWTPEEDRAKLGKIAPALFVPWDTCDWREQLRMTAAFVDKTDEAERWLERFAAKAAFLRNRVRKAFGGEPVAVLSVIREQLYVRGGPFVTFLREDLGFRTSPGSPEREWLNEIEVSRLPEIAADRLWIVIDHDEASRRTWERMRRDPAWANVPAVANGKVTLLPRHPWSEYSAFANGLILEEASQMVDAAGFHP